MSVNPYPSITRWVVAALVALFVARRGLKRASLSPSGAVAAACVGWLTLGSAWTFGIILLSFYFSSTALTRYKSAVKNRFDLEHKGGGGQRNWVQVFATAGGGALLAIAYVWRFGFFGAAEWRLTLPALTLAISPNEMLARTVQWTLTESGALTLIVLGYIGNFATVCGDTWASELGVLARAPPVLVTSLCCCAARRVPRGTNGGMSAWGTAMSAAGGLFIGFVAWLLLCAMPAAAASLRGLSGTGRSSAIARANTAASPLALFLQPNPPDADDSSTFSLPGMWLLGLGLWAGLAGSVVDSLLGALLQRSWVELRSGRVTSRLPAGATVLFMPSDEQRDAVMAEQARKQVGPPQQQFVTSVAAALAHGSAGDARRRGGGAHSQQRDAAEAADGRDGVFVVICGHDIVSNEAVNLLSSACMALLTPAHALLWTIAAASIAG